MFADECGQTLKAHNATRWAPQGQTPVVKVTAKDTVRVSVAGLCCYRPGERSRLIYRTLLYRGRQGEPNGFRKPDLIRLLDAAVFSCRHRSCWSGTACRRMRHRAMRAAIAARS
uniref:hypothetical protein n=1 Tax=Paractinoplanes polyasparticus TaxID=2856853 RepID=UPI00210636BD|nr:hypothetical protein [Actinoplanes polyasparticus]